LNRSHELIDSVAGHWRKIVSDPAKFEADLLAHLNLAPDEFQQLIDRIRF
jgi:hypothetical protein